MKNGAISVIWGGVVLGGFGWFWVMTLIRRGKVLLSYNGKSVIIATKRGNFYLLLIRKLYKLLRNGQETLMIWVGEGCSPPQIILKCGGGGCVF